MSESEMQIRDFPNSYKLKMIRAYPIIAQMDADEEYFATHEERDEAFGRILANRNLRPVHEMFLAEGAEIHKAPDCGWLNNDWDEGRAAPRQHRQDHQ